MGRKSKAELLNLIERIMKLSTEEHKTYEEIESILNAEGIAISKSAIGRSLKSSREAAADFSIASAEAKVLIDTVRDNPGTDVMEATMALLARRLFESSKNIDFMEFTDPSKMIEAVHKLAQGTAQFSKLRMEFQKGFETAKKAVVDALKEEMKNHPDLLEKMAEIVSSLKMDEDAA